MANPFEGYQLADEQPPPQTARRKPPSRAPEVDPFAAYALADSSEVAPDTAQQRTAQAVAAFMAQKPTKPEDRAQAAAGQQLPSGYDGAMQVLFPRSFAQAGEEGGADAWTRLKDGLSLPGRATVATVGALADLAGSAAASIPRELRGEGDAVANGNEALSSAFDVFRREMADPSGLMGGAAPGVSNMAASVAKDPLLPVLSALAPAPAGQMFAGLGKFAPAARAGATATEATVPLLGLQALEKAGTGEEMGAGDMAAAFGLSFAPTLAGEALPVAAPWLNKVAKERFTAGIKPRQRTGKEAEGLEKFLEAGGLPKVSRMFDLQWNRPAEKFFHFLENGAGPEYQRALAAADATATASGMAGMVPKGRMAQGAEQGILDFATERPGAFTAQDMAAARDDVFDRLGMAGADPDAARKIAFGTGNGVAALPTHLMPSEAQRLKSGLAADAYKRKEMSKAVEAAEEGAASAAREILGQKYPEIATLNQAWSPWYAARQAMETARQRGANRGFFTNLRNFPESPGFARGAYEAGRAAGATGPVLQRFNPLAIPALQVVNQNR